jgi:hypothetical protein
MISIANHHFYKAAWEYAATENLPAITRLVLINLADSSDADGHCSVTYDSLAYYSGVKSTATVGLAIKELMHRGVVTRVRGRAGAVSYTLHLDMLIQAEVL